MFFLNLSLNEFLLLHDLFKSYGHVKPRITNWWVLQGGTSVISAILDCTAENYTILLKLGKLSLCVIFKLLLIICDKVVEYGPPWFHLNTFN